MAKSKNNFYAVAEGRKAGIYTSWAEAELQVKGYKGAVHMAFKTKEEAEDFMKNPLVYNQTSGTSSCKSPRSKQSKKSATLEIKEDGITIFTDGCSIGNPGPGGYGIVLLSSGNQRKELSGGCQQTTNNRMELMACIVALNVLKTKTKPVMLYSDSKYVVDSITLGRAENWRSNNWIKSSDKKPASNPDLWSELLDLVDSIDDITFEWIKGHAGYKENERCDALANEAARQDYCRLRKDTGYQPGN